MANESRLFNLINGVTEETVATAIENFMRTEKSMEVQSSKTVDGYVIQGSQPKDAWKTISGTRLAITVQIIVTGQSMNIMIGEGQWSDKLGAGAIGWFVAWPLAATALYGMYRQKTLPQEIFSTVEKCIMMGGQTIAVHGAGSCISEDQVVCPACKTICDKDAKFCNACGAALIHTCPRCGTAVKPGSKFCSECGEKV